MQGGEEEQRLRELIGPLRRYLRRRCDPDTAEDVLAEVLVVCWRRRDELQRITMGAPEGSESPALAWAYGVARWCLANAERSERRRTRLTARVAGLDPAPEIVPAADGGAQGERVRRALATLRPGDAEVLRLWAWEGLGPTDIGEVLGLGVNAATLRLSRARARLRRALGGP